MMNERIRELAEQAYTGLETDPVLIIDAQDLEKFAMSIVKECAEIALVDGQSSGNFDTFNKIQKHFGVK